MNCLDESSALTQPDRCACGEPRAPRAIACDDCLMAGWCAICGARLIAGSCIPCDALFDPATRRK